MKQETTQNGSQAQSQADEQAPAQEASRKVRKADGKSKEGVLKEPATDRLTPKQAKFAALYVELSNASEAYRRAYDVSPDTKDECIHVNACKLLASAKVSLRVDELHAEAMEVAKLNRAWVLQRLMRNVDKAMDLQDMTASNKALELLGKVDELSMFVERSNATNTTTVRAESVPALAAFVAAALGDSQEEPAAGTIPH
jgi:hypothetical protein